MSLWKIAWRSIQQRALASSLTGLSMALGVALVVAVLVMSGVIGQSFQSGSGLGYNMIVGAKGGSLQLVLNTVYHLSKPVENIPYWYYQEFLTAAQRGDGVDGKFANRTEQAIPVLMGDYYGEYRVVATTPQMFEDFEYVPDKRFEFAEGHGFKQDEFFTGVVGSVVAKRMNLKLGDGINPEHGQPGGHTHDNTFKIVGILKPTGTPADKGVFINMEGFYLMEGHALVDERPKEAPKPTSNDGKSAADKQAADEKTPADAKSADSETAAKASVRTPLPNDKREVTAILLKTKSSRPDIPRELVAPGLIKDINKDFVAQAVLPIGEISRLFDTLVGPLTTILFGLTVLIVIVSAIGIMVSIYNSMSERRHEIAIMRALGARRGKIMSIVLLESILLALLGGLCGWLLGHGLVAGLSPFIAERTGVEIGFGYLAPPVNVVDWEVSAGENPLRIQIDAYPEVLLIPALIVLASLVGFLPALSAYRTDVSKSLTATP